MAPTTKKILVYKEENMIEAIKDAERGMPIATAAKKHGVPRTTLIGKVKGKTPKIRKMGRDPYITTEKERWLVKWIKSMAASGFPVTKNQLCNSVAKLVQDQNLDTPFKNYRPGKRWYSSFLKRHPDISTRVSQNLTLSRASVTNEQLLNWFNEVKNYLVNNNYSDILNDPSRVFNADETAFFLNPKGHKVLATKGDKNIYQQVNPDEKECLTVLFTGNAAGKFVPPMIIYKYERIPKDICLSVPTNWGIGRSESGWMTGATFYEFVANVFDKFLLENRIKKPVVLFIDGHTSHLTLNVSRLCSQKGIILVALFPNATHLIQPMDVAVFHSLKSSWTQAVHNWRLENIDNPVLRKFNFAPLLKKVIDENLKPSILINGFRTCGLVPWDPQKVKVTKEKKNERTLSDRNQFEELKSGLEFIEKFVDKKKIFEFKKTKGSDWQGPTEDKSLYEVYKTISCLLDSSALHLSTDDIEIKTPHTTTPHNTTSKNIQTNRPSPTSTPKKRVVVETETTIALDPSSTEVQNKDEKDIPSPFKKVLYWPEPKPTTKKRRSEKIPSVVTSDQWQSYYESKEKKKTDLLEEKHRRAEERQKKKALKEQEKLQKKIKKRTNIIKKKQKTKKAVVYDTSSSEEEWINSGDSMADIISDKEESDLESIKIFDVRAGPSIANQSTSSAHHNFISDKDESDIENIQIFNVKAGPSVAKQSTYLGDTSSKKVLCNICNILLKSMDKKSKCMACKSMSCIICAGGDVNFDYLCNKCLRIDSD